VHAGKLSQLQSTTPDARGTHSWKDRYCKAAQNELLWTKAKAHGTEANFQFGTLSRFAFIGNQGLLATLGSDLACTPLLACIHLQTETLGLQCQLTRARVAVWDLRTGDKVQVIATRQYGIGYKRKHTLSLHRFDRGREERFVTCVMRAVMKQRDAHPQGCRDDGGQAFHRFVVGRLRAHNSGPSRARVRERQPHALITFPPVQSSSSSVLCSVQRDYRYLRR
jgi:hypothetical protein